MSGGGGGGNTAVLLQLDMGLGRKRIVLPYCILRPFSARIVPQGKVERALFQKSILNIFARRRRGLHQKLN